MDKINIFTDSYNEIYGDILSCDSINQDIIICHQVNCKGVMGAGLALQIKEKYPEVYNKYKLFCEEAKSSADLLGKILYCNIEVNSMNVTFANIFGQISYGKNGVYTDYNALKEAFINLRHKLCELNKTNKTIVRIPKNIGCGHGGGDWKIVFDIIVKELINKDVQVEIWSINS